MTPATRPAFVEIALARITTPTGAAVASACALIVAIVPNAIAGMVAPAA
jgi:hypothetical protein